MFLRQEGAWKPVAQPGKNMYDVPRVWSPFSSAPWRMPFTKQWHLARWGIQNLFVRPVSHICERNLRMDAPCPKSRASCRDFKTWCNIPASSNVCKIIASSGIIAGGIFSASEQFFAFLSFCMRLPVLKRRKNPTKRRKKSRAQNSETETRKKMDTAKISATGDNCCCFGFRAIILHRWIIQEWYSNSPDRKSKPSRF